MDWTKILKKEKQISSLQLEKQDVTYQSWELGRTIATITEYLKQMPVQIEQSKSKQINFDLVNSAQSSVEYLRFLTGKLCNQPNPTLSNFSELQDEIFSIFNSEESISSMENKDIIIKEIDDWHQQIQYELRAKSIHLSNIYCFGYSLKTLRLKLAYDIHYENIEKLIESNIDNLEKLEKGDKQLTSPNLQITPHNLRIIKYRLNGILKHLPDLVNLADRDQDRFRHKLLEKSEIWDMLIFDIKNPSDYITTWRRIKNNVAKLVVGYYLTVTPVVIFFQYKPDKLDIDALTAIAAMFLPLYTYFAWHIYNRIRNWLIISSFKFKIAEFSPNE